MPNKKKNPFYFFMKDFQSQQAAKGVNFTMKKLPDYAHPIWQKMSAVERQKYEDVALRHRNDPALRGGKLASDGTRVQDNLRAIEEAELKEHRMMLDIREHLNVDRLTDEDLKNSVKQKFLYFISFNLMCITDKLEYIPLEVGITEYSIESGINREFHRLVYPGGIPQGCCGKAKEYSAKHYIDIFRPEETSETSMSSLLKSIKSFVNPQDYKWPPFFCKEDDIKRTRGCLDWIQVQVWKEKSKKKQEFHMEEFQIWNSKYLLLELRAAAGHPLPSNTTASDLLARTDYNFYPASRCDFHNEEARDTDNCAMVYVKVQCYLISDAVCQLMGVELTDRHLPSQYSEEASYVVTMPNHSSRNGRGPVAPSSVRQNPSKTYYQNQNQQEYEEGYACAAAAPPPPRHVPVPVPQPTNPYQAPQPVTDCVSAQMARLGLLPLDTAAAARPGLGIGRGQRRIN